MIDINGRLHSTEKNVNVVAGADEILDDTKNKKQSDINTETYALVNEINAKLATLSPEQQSALSVATKANKNEANLGYYVCYTAANVAAKIVANATGYVLAAGGSIKIKMNNTNDVTNATLNINSTGDMPLYYNGKIASATNTWEAGETIEVYFDGDSYYANNVSNGGKFSTGEKISNIGIDSEPTAGSDNLVKSGGVQNELALGAVYDVSAKNPTAGPNNDGKWESLSALLTDVNLNTLIPASVRKGGMSIKFVQSSDNKYLQYRLTANEWSINTNDWAIADEGVYVENPEFIYVKTDANDKILFGIKVDGEPYFGVGCPEQVKEYVEEKIADLSLEEYEDIVSFLADYLGSDTTLKVMINGINAAKVDKEEGKSLIDKQYIEEYEYDELIKFTCDAEGKVIEAIKNDGTKKYFGNVDVGGEVIFDNVSVSAVDSTEYVSAEVDEDGKVISGVKKDGTKVVNTALELRGNRQYVEDLDDFAQATIDGEGKIIEGITNEGKKHISDFDDKTLATIKEGIGGEDITGGVFKIAVLNAGFDSALPYDVEGVKGDASAKYTFHLPLGNAWNIRAKFRITEDILNENKTAVIASINGAEVVANPVPLHQCITDTTLGSYNMHNAWSATEGGICYNCQGISSWKQKKNIGRQALSIQYVGSGNVVTLANDGNGLILSVDGTETVYSFEEYPTMDELHAALSLNTDLVVNGIALNCHDSSELAKFTAVDLVATIQGHNNQGYEPEPISFIDKAPFYLHYSLDERWHQIEIVRIGDKIYSTCDGNIVEYNADSDENSLVLGGDCDVLFKELEIDTNSPSDAEIVVNSGEKYIISCVNPYIVIFEGHEVVTYPAYKAGEYPSEKYNLGTSTLAWIFDMLRRKGYEAVSIEEMSDYFAGDKTLPKRCYVMIFDDYRWNIALDTKIRRVFEEYGSKPCLAVITSRGYKKLDDGVTDNPKYEQIYHKEYVSGAVVNTPITEGQAAEIAKNAGFSLCTHTKDHRSTYAVAPSDRVSVVEKDILDADKFGINGLVYVYPGGNNDPYMHEVLEYMGVKMGVEIMSGPLYNNTLRSRFALSRINISRAYQNGAKLDYKNNVLKRVL